MADAHFFKSPVSKTQSAFIDVGGDSFHALAAALIDYFDSDKAFKEPALKTLLAQLESSYPDLQVRQPRLQPLEHMRILMRTVRPSELILCMSYVLGQMTWVALRAQPMICPEVFKDLPENADYAYLKQESIALPSEVLHLVPKALGLDLVLLFAEPEKELRGRKVYFSGNTTGAGLTIQVVGTYYFPWVSKVGPFSYVGQVKVQTPIPHYPPAQENLLSAVQTMVAQDTQEALETYNKAKRTLSGMKAAGEITKESLQALYMKWLSLDEGLESYYRGLLSQKKHPVADEVTETSATHFENQLIDSLAIWVATTGTEEILNLESPSSRPPGGAVL